MKKLLLNKRMKFIVALLILWELIARIGVFPDLLFPSLLDIFNALSEGIKNGELFTATGYSLYLILMGLIFGLLLALLFATFSMLSKTFADFLETIIAVMHPLPGLALLPLTILWFGTGEKAIIFIIIHSTLWPMILNTLAGFKSVPVIHKEVGQNIGLKGTRFVLSILLPSSFPYLLTGLKIAWARSWRALIGAEMVFGASGTHGGLGWYIFQQRFFMDISGVFAALVVIIILGLIVEDFIFGIIEKRTVKRWGMTN